ncbi:vWA domain-containing protein [Butyrivibrio sp. WCE2006]|uniref:vWA domain-containing protein n=1 Tax=Butyrivibrio sp. WCE2006 TaxID=1410611 RepID=UPI0005D19DEC|nr:VWA-like domain-containing protein [Butyrivibrio sp. WCE2006]
MTKNEQQEKLGNKIWNSVKTELLLSMRFLAPALSVLEIRKDLSTTSVGTDGESVLYNPNYVFKTYVEDPSKLNRTYLHMLLHCMFRHLYRAAEFGDNEMWDLACDIAVEHILDSMDYQCIYRVSSDLRERWYDKLQEELKVLTAEKIYHYFESHVSWGEYSYTNSSSENVSFLDKSESYKRSSSEAAGNSTGSDIVETAVEDSTGVSKSGKSGEKSLITEDTWNRLVREFKFDDHGFWERLEDKKDENQKQDKPDIDMQMQMRLRRANKKEIEDAWKNTAKRIKSDIASLGDEKSKESGSLKFYLKAETADKVYYTEFLNQIAVVREEIRIDPDSFDYGLYNYGMEIYGNMPLIEENEYSESHKIDELVIAIDTSASCSEELVQSFLNETAGILRMSDNFFRQIHVHIIECDNKVQKDIEINHPEEMEEYARNFEVAGGYGTDFRPVFSYVDDLRRKGQLKHLRGLMYFTDGFGDYPENPTDYDTAFVFPMDKQNGADKMPNWAIQLYIDY